jgi:methylenetetrahydrofolate reductase (NADPH)
MARLPLARVAQDKLCLTGELSLGRIENFADLDSQIKELSEVVDAIHVPHHTRFSDLSLSRILLDHGVDPILQISSVNRSFTELELELRAAISMGIENVLLVKGEESNEQKTGRFSATAMLEHASDVRRELDAICLFGTVAKVFKPAVSWRPATLIKKVEAGARFIRTQLCFNPVQLSTYLQFLNKSGIADTAPLIVSTSVLPNAESAQWLNQNMKGTKVPAHLIKRLADSDNPEQEGIDIAVEIIAELKEMPGIGGISLITLGDPHLIRRVAQLSDLCD